MRNKKEVIVPLVVGIAIGIFSMLAIINKYYKAILSQKDERINKFVGYFNILDQWLALRNDNKRLDHILIEKGYKTVAIYGLGVMGNHLYEELRDSKVKVAYAIDERSDEIYADISVVNLEDKLMEVDAIIVTATFAFEAIKVKLSEKCKFPILSLSDLICEEY